MEDEEDDKEESKPVDVIDVKTKVETKWEKVKLTVDSGAVDTVGPPTVGKGIPIKPTAASKAGRHYKAANGTRINNLGEKQLRAYTQENELVGLTMQAGETVNKFLGSVNKITRANNSVIFAPPGYESYIYNWDTGSKTVMKEEGGVYVLELWVEVPDSDEDKITGFAGQARQFG